MIPLGGLITLPALTRNFTAEDYAVWMQAVFIVALLAFILNLCLGYAVIRFLAAEDDRLKRRQALGVMLWPTVALSGLAIIISILLKRDISIILFTNADYAHLVPLIFLWGALDGIFSILIAYWMARRQIIKLSISLMTLALYKMVIIVTLSMVGSSLSRIIGCIAAGEIIIIFIILGIIITDIGWLKPGLEGLKGYLTFSIPLIPSGVLFWLISYIDRYFITYLLNLSQAGIYSASFSIGMLIFFFYSPLQFVLFPVVSKLWEQNEQLKIRSYLEYSNRLFLALSVPGAAGLYILSQPLLGILTTAEYMTGGGLVLLLAIATILLGLYQINVNIIILVKQTKWLVLIITVAAIANLGVNLVLIPIMGIIGAAISAIVSNLILAVAAIIWARNVIRYRISIKFIAKVTVGAILMAWCISFIHIGGILGIAVISIAGVMIISLWLWLTRAFSAEDIKLIKEIILGFKQGTLLR
jgi:O-antigen/teichoic acid export membrane protein